MAARVEADPFNPGAFRVMAGDTAQSWVDPADPLRLEFEYVQRICEALDATVLARPADERVRVVHLGGAGLTIPRYVAARRPRTAQIVCEPDADLIEEVRRVMPLPKQSGIKVRTIDGRAGLAAMPPTMSTPSSWTPSTVRGSRPSWPRPSSSTTWWCGGVRA